MPKPTPPKPKKKRKKPLNIFSKHESTLNVRKEQAFKNFQHDSSHGAGPLINSLITKRDMEINRKLDGQRSEKPRYEPKDTKNDAYFDKMAELMSVMMSRPAANIHERRAKIIRTQELLNEAMQEHLSDAAVKGDRKRIKNLKRVMQNITHNINERAQTLEKADQDSVELLLAHKQVSQDKEFSKKLKKRINQTILDLTEEDD